MGTVRSVARKSSRFGGWSSLSLLGRNMNNKAISVTMGIQQALNKLMVSTPLLASFNPSG